MCRVCLCIACIIIHVISAVYMYVVCTNVARQNCILQGIFLTSTAKAMPLPPDVDLVGFDHFFARALKIQVNTSLFT